MKVEILLNRQPTEDPERRLEGGLAIFDRRIGESRYRPGDRLEQVYELALPGTDDDVVLNRAYEVFNINHPADYCQRSLSCGDIVLLDGWRAYSCESVGWAEVPVATVLSGLLRRTEVQS